MSFPSRDPISEDICQTFMPHRSFDVSRRCALSSSRARTFVSRTDIRLHQRFRSEAWSLETLRNLSEPSRDSRGGASSLLPGADLVPISSMRSDRSSSSAPGPAIWHNKSTNNECCRASSHRCDPPRVAQGCKHRRPLIWLLGCSMSLLFCTANGKRP